MHCPSPSYSANGVPDIVEDTEGVTEVEGDVLRLGEDVVDAVPLAVARCDGDSVGVRVLGASLRMTTACKLCGRHRGCRNL